MLLHWMTSVARSSTDRGTVRPNAWAVFRLTTMSYIVGSSIGTYPTDHYGGAFGNSMKLPAQVIAADVGTSIFYVSLSGFDTDAAQSVEHNRRLDILDTSLDGFFQDRVQGPESRLPVTSSLSPIPSFVGGGSRPRRACRRTGPGRAG